MRLNGTENFDALRMMFKPVLFGAFSVVPERPMCSASSAEGCEWELGRVATVGEMYTHVWRGNRAIYTLL